MARAHDTFVYPPQTLKLTASQASASRPLPLPRIAISGRRLAQVALGKPFGSPANRSMLARANWWKSLAEEDSSL